MSKKDLKIDKNSKTKKVKKYGFTLVELIVVISILTILGTIAFISFQNYNLTARDGTRVTDVKSIQKALSFYVIKTGNFPDPSDGKKVLYSGSTVWIQGTFGDSMLSNVGVLNKKPVDPLKQLDYAYSVTSDRQEYQLVGVLESEEWGYKSPFINKTNAYGNYRAYSVGTYNGVIAKTQTGAYHYLLAVPSIVSNNLTSTELTDIINNKSLVYNDYGNFPSNFSEVYSSENKFNFYPNKILIFTGVLNDFKDTVKQLELLKSIQEAYSGTLVISTDDQIKKIVETEIDISDPSGKAKILACSTVNFSLRVFVQCNNIDYVTFYIINVLHLDINNLPGENVNSVYKTSDGEIRFGTDAGIGHYDGTNWEVFDTSNTNNLVSNMILAIAQASDGDIWFGTDHGISIYDGTNWTAVNQQNSGLIQNHILEIYSGADGKMRIGTNAGVSSYDSGVWQDYTKQKSGLTHNQVNAIFEDNKGYIWFGTKQGLDKYKNGVIEATYTTSNGLPANNVTYIFQDLSDNMWFATDAGIAKYNRVSLTSKTNSNTSGGLSSNHITYIFQNSSNGDLWFGSSDNGAIKYIEGTNSWSTYNVANGKLSGNVVSSITKNLNGDIVVINDGGIDTITN